MTAIVSPLPHRRHWIGAVTMLAPAAAAGGFIILFARVFADLARDWWTDPNAGHGLLILPLAGFLAWRSAVAPNARPGRAVGSGILTAAVLMRCFAGLAAEPYTMRVSMVLALAGLVVFYLGIRQLHAWWLPFVLLILAIPLPEIVLAAIAFPLQLKASALGAAMLNARHVPAAVAGNVILIPGRELFVTEACSGLRSLTALLSLGVLLGGTMLRSVVSRGVILGVVIPVAVALNAVRVFITGFTVHFIGPEAGSGILHATEGWATFIVAFAILGGLTWLLGRWESRSSRGQMNA
jgi:exosortase